LKNAYRRDEIQKLLKKEILYVTVPSLNMYLLFAIAKSLEGGSKVDLVTAGNFSFWVPKVHRIMYLF
jgi:hypothetical protein